MGDERDAPLIAAARRGDPSALERLITRWDGEVLNLAYRLTGNREDARDLRQLAFIRMCTAIERFDGRARFSSWLFRIVVNLCRDHVRGKASQRRLLRRAAELAPLAAEGPGRADGSERREMNRVVADSVLSLPTPMREVVVLRHYHRLAFAEIAAVLEIPASTARSRMIRALGLLRERLERLESCPCEEGQSP